MTKALAAVAAAGFLGSPAWSQEPQQSPPQAEPSTEAPAERQGQPEAQPEAGSPSPAAVDEAKDAPAETAGQGQPEDSVLDDQTYEGEDDDFIPTEEIPLNEPIPFPTDI